MIKGAWKRKRGIYANHVRVWEILELSQHRKNQRQILFVTQKQ